MTRFQIPRIAPLCITLATLSCKTCPQGGLPPSKQLTETVITHEALEGLHAAWHTYTNGLTGELLSRLGLGVGQWSYVGPGIGPYAAYYTRRNYSGFDPARKISPLKATVAIAFESNYDRISAGLTRLDGLAGINGVPTYFTLTDSAEQGVDPSRVDRGDAWLCVVHADLVALVSLKEETLTSVHGGEHAIKTGAIAIIARRSSSWAAKELGDGEEKDRPALPQWVSDVVRDRDDLAWIEKWATAATDNLRQASGFQLGEVTEFELLEAMREACCMEVVVRASRNNDLVRVEWSHGKCELVQGDSRQTLSRGLHLCTSPRFQQEGREKPVPIVVADHKCVIVNPDEPQFVIVTDETEYTDKRE